MNKNIIDNLKIITDEEKKILEGSKLSMDNYVSENKNTIDSKKMLANGELIAIRPHTRFTYFPQHSHNYVEIMYVCSGKIDHVINGKDNIVLNEGEILFLNRHCRHAIKRAGLDDVAVNFIVLPQFFERALGMIGSNNTLGKFLLSSIRNETDGINWLHFHVAGIIPVQNLVENLIYNIISENKDSESVKETTMGLLMMNLLNIPDKMTMPKPVMYENKLVMAALSEIDTDCKTASLSHVAEENNISISYLSNLITQTTGKNFKEILCEKRLEKAASLLISTKLPTEIILNIVGYENSSFFYRIFKNKFNMTPRQYRKSCMR